VAGLALLIISTVAVVRSSVHEYVTRTIVRPPAGIEADTLKQPLNHFAALDGRSWDMRFWLDDRFFASGSGAAADRVFLSMGGEGASGPPGGQQQAIAQELFEQDGRGVLLASIEHRYYGESTPTGANYSTASLRYLGTAQALADAAAFRRHVSVTLNLSEDALWVCFGGSYSGELAAWARLKYPHLFHAAVASSAPVTASIDYWGYNPIVAQALADPFAGGSAACHDLVGEAFDSFTQMLDDESSGGGRAQIGMLFNTCGSIETDGDGWMLHDWVSDDFMGLVQYNDPSPDATHSVRQTCTTLLDAATGATPLARLVNITRDRSPPGQCINNPTDGSGAKTISWNEHLGLLARDDKPSRAWFYQQCVDGSGHDQTCRKESGCLFSPRYASPQLFAELCTRLFGTIPDVTDAAVLSNSVSYGDNRTGGTNILYVNGDLDPFHWGSVTRNTSGALARNVMALLIRGGSHCADMGSPSPHDLPAMAEAKLVKRAWVRAVVGLS